MADKWQNNQSDEVNKEMQERLENLYRHTLFGTDIADSFDPVGRIEDRDIPKTEDDSWMARMVKEGEKDIREKVEAAWAAGWPSRFSEEEEAYITKGADLLLGGHNVRLSSPRGRIMAEEMLRRFAVTKVAEIMSRFGIIEDMGNPIKGIPPDTTILPNKQFTIKPKPIDEDE